MPVVRHVALSSVPALEGKVVLVTGANSGIGLEASRLFAARGAKVLLACRDPRRGDDAKLAILATVADAKLEVIPLDLASIASIRAGAARVLSEHPHLDALVHNAGVMAIPRTLTPDGFEMQFAVNHLGGFALTALLAPILLDREVRIVSTSSLLAHRGRMNFEDLQGERVYDKRRAYSQSKLCNQLFAFELERRLRASGRKAVSLACHPGYSDTNLQVRGPDMAGSKWGRWFAQTLNGWFAQPAARGAEATVIAAASPEVNGAEIVGYDGWMEMNGKTAVMAAPAAALDPDEARRLWETSEELLRIGFTV
jgi:NAD(P)-dependent dehydrogenase (short-subunit alcohol dehydrogenase family)